MMENVLTFVALMGAGCIVTGAVCIALAKFWSDGNE